MFVNLWMFKINNYLILIYRPLNNRLCKIAYLCKLKVDVKAECSVKIKKKVNKKIVRLYGCSLNKKSKNNHMHTKIIMFHVQIYSLQSDI